MICDIKKLIFQIQKGQMYPWVQNLNWKFINLPNFSL